MVAFQEKWETVPLLVMPECDIKRRTSSPIVSFIGSTARKALKTKEANGTVVNNHQAPKQVEISLPEKTVSRHSENASSGACC